MSEKEHLIDFIGTLSKIVKDSELTELDVKLEDTHIKIKRVDTHVETGNYIQATTPVMVNASSTTGTSSVESKPTSPTDDIPSGEIVKSPMVGIAYLSPNPDSPNFVSVGSTVKAGDTLLLVEAMKTFNPIKAPKSGVVKAIFTTTGHIVEYDEHLMIIE